jgi:hypothetical protein
MKLKTFNLKGKINEVPFSKRTSDIKKTLLEIKPDFFYTDTYIGVSSGSKMNKLETERKLSLTNSKRVFGDDVLMDIFVNNLLVEFN